MRHKHADVIHAWAEGEEIEYKDGKEWIFIGLPAWNPNTEYRIKPKKVKKEGWVNVYSVICPTEKVVAMLGHIIYRTKEQADEGNANQKYIRKACIRIEWEEEE